MRKLNISLLLVIEFLILMRLLDWSLEKISTPDDFLMSIGFIGVILIVFIVYFTHKLFKKYWK